MSPSSQTPHPVPSNLFNADNRATPSPISIGSTVDFERHGAKFRGLVVDRAPDVRKIFVAVLGHDCPFMVDETSATVIPPELQCPPRLLQLWQLRIMTRDEAVKDAKERDSLIAADLAVRVAGWNMITPEGLKTLVHLGML